jgi:hypothetical protein
MIKTLDEENIMEKTFYELEDCPICRGTGMIMHEGGWNVQVECADCSAHTVYVEYNNEEQKIAAEKQVVTLWNLGKVVHGERGE